MRGAKGRGDAFLYGCRRKEVEDTVPICIETYRDPRKRPRDPWKRFE